jgi:hypothetical protein
VLLGGAGPQSGRVLGRLGLLSAAVVCWGFVSTLTNDRVERDHDSAAGKQRWIGAIAPAWAAAAILAFFAAGWVSLLEARVRPEARWAYLAATLLGLAYSLRPLRLKERGAWGLCGYSLSCACAYALLPWAALGAGPEALAFVGLAVGLDKWVHLHFHQIVDHDADLAGGVRTYAVRAGLDQARRVLRWFAWASAGACAAAIVYAAALLPARRAPILALTAGVLLASALLARGARRFSPLRTALLCELPWAYLGLSLAAFRVVPLFIFSAAALARSPLRPACAALSVLIAADAWLLLRYRYE